MNLSAALMLIALNPAQAQYEQCESFLLKAEQAYEKTRAYAFYCEKSIKNNGDDLYGYCPEMDKLYTEIEDLGYLEDYCTPGNVVQRYSKHPAMWNWIAVSEERIKQVKTISNAFLGDTK